MRSESVTCDVCGISKREVNHWLVMSKNKRSFLVDCFQSVDKGNDICGEECAHKALSQWFQEVQDAKTAATQTDALPDPLH
jgi:hypothetical protein